ncbi:uncharacterized protein RMCC_2971 [Mycolicibacterium canariasense]|uniref:Lipoprotein n=1 Tax=Mycolicibacterium canariasense TaxID=228230 RepID=A0A117IA90_MYCCR|nr:hypothetical protein [Mycolicibacterium canariasense]MCV7207928.1 hypothetical protein [Mycolicibacterium canariasense]ORV05025.1 hypothetical protein AWB94_21815 [Mycolicibacterium canariasense]GAS96005.1 uncharacterized protein RMCC_2971 [Mycolicibacterium canariasense]
MTKFTRILFAGAAAMLALGTVACSGGAPTQAGSSAATAASSPSATPFPQSARYMADTVKDGKKMAIGISVDGDSVTAYACNGVDDEAWFFGNQTAGSIDITSKFRDTLDASFTGSDVKGSLTMNGITYDFTAAPVSAPAGMYSAALDGVRASWIVRPDGSVTGVQFNGGITGRDFEQAELQQLNAAQFQAQVRNKRKLQQADQSVKLANNTLSSRINGREVTGQLVTGTTRFG